ncbi:hypothetical protein EIK77_007379 [Talaromyces pinophilus]|nr:hypothetical protein EIK77_007379 [Talaromyces pinophilus]PCG96160.1 Hypothetical protein PENO1_069900 [Penicillium occitanis (nom. inval.)]PCG96450.1 hypothetical protein PENOC_072830 [Penicillium occitanis (nom. inval.)]
MRTSLILSAALTALTVQADSSSTITGFFAPNWDVNVPEYGGYTSTAASLAAINTDAATYHVGCVSGAPKTDCDYPSSWTIVQGPATVSVTAVYIASTSGSATSYDLTVTESYECSLKSSTQSASCTMSVGITGSVDGAKYTSSTSTSATYTTAPLAAYDQLTVTAGLSSLTATATGTTKTGGAAAATGVVGSMITAAPVVAAAVAALL